MVLGQYGQRFLYKAGCKELPIILAVKNKFCADVPVSNVYSRYLAHSVPSSQPSKRMRTAFLYKTVVFGAVAIFNNDELLDRERVVFQKAVQRNFKKILSAAARDHDGNFAKPHCLLTLHARAAGRARWICIRLLFEKEIGRYD